MADGFLINRADILLLLLGEVKCFGHLRIGEGPASLVLVRDLLEPFRLFDDPVQKIAEIRKKMAERQKASTDKIMKRLTEAQKTKWKELQGEPLRAKTALDLPGLLRSEYPCG